MIWFFGTSHTAGTCHGKWHQIYPEHYVGKEDFLKDQFYKGNKNNAITFLKERIKLIIEQSPWLGGTLVKDQKKHGKLIAIRYPKNNVPFDKIIQIDDTLKISNDMPYQEIVNILNY